MTLEEIPNLAGTDEDVARWIWHNLVPESGQASSLQGELLRAVEKLRWEAQSNGNINWDDQFEMFLDFLDDHLQREPRFSSDIRASIASDLGRLRNFHHHAGGVPVEPLRDHGRGHGLHCLASHVSGWHLRL